MLELLDSEDAPDADLEEGVLDENGGSRWQRSSKPRLIPDDGECPICQARLPIASIPLHIERGCPPPKSVNERSGNQKQDWKKVFAGAGASKDKKCVNHTCHLEKLLSSVLRWSGSGSPTMRWLRQQNFGVFFQWVLRNVQTADRQRYDVPTAGDQSALVWRVKQWIIIFNANLDTSHPQSISALRAKLKTAEVARQKEKDKGKEDKIADIDQYAREKKGEFERLRRDILERDKRKREGLEAESPIEVD